MAYYEFSVGKIRCMVMSDGSDSATAADFAGMFPSQPEIQSAFLALPEPAELAYNCLLIESDGQLILCDTGQGTLDESHPPQLLNNLREANVTPEQIQIVVITHVHRDHIGGVLNDAGQKTFPNARYIMSRVEWDHWTGPERRARAERFLLPIKDEITLIDLDAQIVPGVSTIAATGHTPGHIGILIESQGEKLIDFVDAAHHPLQVVHPTWSPNFDSDPVQSATSRTAIFKRAAQENCRVLAYHFPYPGLGTVQADGDSFRFVPVEK